MPNKIFPAGAELSFQIRTFVEWSDKGRYNLELLDFNALIQELGFETSPKLTGFDAPRASRQDDGPRALRHGRGPVFDARIRGFAGGRGQAAGGENGRAGGLLCRGALPGATSEWCRATAAKDFGPVCAALSSRSSRWRRRWSIICCEARSRCRSRRSWRCSLTMRTAPSASAIDFRRHLGQRRLGAESRGCDRQAAHHSLGRRSAGKHRRAGDLRHSGNRFGPQADGRNPDARQRQHAVAHAASGGESRHSERAHSVDAAAGAANRTRARRCFSR